MAEYHEHEQIYEASARQADGTTNIHHLPDSLPSPTNDASQHETSSSSPTPSFNEKPSEAGLRSTQVKEMVKGFIHEVVKRTDSNSTSNQPSPVKQSPRPWKETLIRFGPLSGILGLCIAMASIFAALGILVGSQNTPTDHWSLEPSAYLAIFTAIANQSIRYATAQGVAIAWWYRASRSTAVDLEQLHHDWKAGTTIRGAFTSGRHLGLLGLACIFSTIVAVDGPLLQKATSVISGHYSNPVNLEVTIPQELPHGWAGEWTPSLSINGTWTGIFNEYIPTAYGRTPNNLFAMFGPDLTKPILSWGSNLPWSGMVRGCPDDCTAIVKAPALAEVACSTQLIPVNYTYTPDLNNFIAYSGIAPPVNELAFAIEANLLTDDREESINLVTAYQSNEKCIGTLNMTACSLKSAIGEYVYQVNIKNNAVTLAPGLPKIIALANNTQLSGPVPGQPGYYYSTLAAVVGIMTQQYQTCTWLGNERIDGANNWLVSVFGSDDVDQRYMLYTPDNDMCSSYSDPHDDMLEYLNGLMFYLGAWASASEDQSFLEQRIDPGLPLSTNVTGYSVGTQNVYSTNFHWFAGAAVLELVCIALILPTFWGWWKLGRQTSFSPLEIAKAFEAPLLANYNSNSSGSDIARAAANSEVKVQVRYGEVRESAWPGSPPQEWRRKVAFATPDAVIYPQNNTQFDI